MQVFAQVLEHRLRGIDTLHFVHGAAEVKADRFGHVGLAVVSGCKPNTRDQSTYKQLQMSLISDSA
ncbi:hypothetical protein GCM10007386_38070 [Pseudoduganella dura]|nr:hypothetical protein GCM10007386_38070 [Pseudoduganella dura]